MLNLLGMILRNKKKSRKCTKELKKAIAIRSFKVNSPIGDDGLIYYMQVVKGRGYPIRSTVDGNFVIEVGVAPNGSRTILALDDGRFILR